MYCCFIYRSDHQLAKPYPLGNVLGSKQRAMLITNFIAYLTDCHFLWFRNLAPFPQIHRNKFQTGENIEYFGQESLLNNFIASHCADFKMPPQAKSYTQKIESSVMEEDEEYDEEEEERERKAVSSTKKGKGKARPASAKAAKTPVKGKHQCSYCKRLFNNMCNLKAHIRLHTGAKPFKCRYCEKTCATQSNILTHERTHTGVRPYTCDICSNEYSTSSNLKVSPWLFGLSCWSFDTLSMHWFSATWCRLYLTCCRVDLRAPARSMQGLSSWHRSGIRIRLMCGL